MKTKGTIMIFLSFLLLSFTNLSKAQTITVDAAGASTIQTELNAGRSYTINSNLDIIVNSPIQKTAGCTAILTLNATRDIFINAEISSTSGLLNIVFNADSERNSDGAISLLANVTSNGGNINFGSSNTYLVGTIIGGSGTRTINSNGGAINFYGNVILTSDVSLNAVGGSIFFDDEIDAGNSYTLSSSMPSDWNVAKTDAQNNGGYLVTITSSLENSIARSIANNNDVWIGLYKNTSNEWRWKT